MLLSIFLITFTSQLLHAKVIAAGTFLSRNKVCVWVVVIKSDSVTSNIDKF